MTTITTTKAKSVDMGHGIKIRKISDGYRVYDQGHADEEFNTLGESKSYGRSRINGRLAEKIHDLVGRLEDCESAKSTERLEAVLAVLRGK